LLTEEEKKQYLQDIVERGHPDEEDIDEMEPEELRSLYPRRAKVRFQ
jgi:polyhydroxyalkanoate synthesis regulator phasin